MLIFQHFIPRSNINFLTLWIPLKEGFEVKGGPKTGGDFTNNFSIYLHLTHPKTFTRDRVSVCDKYLQWPCVSVKIYIYIATG